MRTMWRDTSAFGAYSIGRTWEASPAPGACALYPISKTLDTPVIVGGGCVGVIEPRQCVARQLWGDRRWT
jgi:hypothetical protein